MNDTVWNGGRGGMCQQVAREAVNASVFGGTALIAWHNIPAEHRHSGKPRGGGIGYMDIPSQSGEAGHAFWIENEDYIWSTDALRRGHIDRIRMTTLAAKWNMRYLGWIDWTPSGALHLLSNSPAVPAPTLKFRQGRAVYSSKMHGGQANSDSVWNVTLALKQRGFVNVATDDFTPHVQEKVARYQRSKGWTGSDADGIPGPGTTAALGLVWVKG